MFENLRVLLEKNGISLYFLSKATGVPYTSLSDWKKGRCKPKAEKLKKIADYFGVPLDYFY